MCHQIHLPMHFIQFFENKIRKIRANMPQPNVDNPFSIFDNLINSDCELCSFSSITSNDLMVMISATSFKSCELDPISGNLLKGCIDIAIPTITKIANMSLDSASLPHELKEAMLNPLLKKPALDTDEFKSLDQFPICTSCKNY